MSISPYATVGPTLVDNGYSAIPIKPGTKLPGSMLFGQWYGRYDWAMYCERLPTQHNLDIWVQYPDAGVCVACGFNGLVAIDIDTEDDAVVEAIMEVLPHSPVAKRGAKGQTLFYRGSANIKSRPFNVKSGRALDLLAHGRQTVLPPTLHPDTGRPYVWITPDTLINTPPEQLPALDDDIAARLEEALAPFGLMALPSPRGSGDAASPTGSGDSVWRDINEAALLTLDKWVPALGLAKTRVHRSGYRAVAEWRSSSTGRPITARAPNLSFNEKGIKDMGDDRTYTPIDVVMEARTLDAASATDWLAERIGFAVDDGPAVAVDIDAFIDNSERVTIHDDEDSVVPRTPIDAPPLEGDFKIDPFDPKVAGGLIGEVAQWILDTAPTPSPEMTMLGAVGFMSALCNRRYMTPTGLGMNVYMIGLAPSGWGKEYPQKVVKLLLQDAGRPELLGPPEVSSGSAVELTVRAQPACIMVMDELGIMLQNMSDRNAAAHTQTIRKALLQLYSKSDAGNTWMGLQTADRNRLNAPVPSPSVSLLGYSTPEEFYKGLPESALRDGFASRLLVIEAKQEGEDRTPPIIEKVPNALLGRIQDVIDAYPLGGNIEPDLYNNSQQRPSLLPAAWDAEVEEEWCGVRDWQKSEIRADRIKAGIMGRVAAHVQKLATLRAISRDAGRPRLTCEDIRWGYAFVRRALASLESGVRQYVADSPYERLCKNILEAVENAPSGKLAWSQLSDRRGISKHDERTRNAAVKDLVNRGLLVTHGRGKSFSLPEKGKK